MLEVWAAWFPGGTGQDFLYVQDVITENGGFYSGLLYWRLGTVEGAKVSDLGGDLLVHSRQG